MAGTKLSKFCTMLLSRTTEGQVKWEVTAVDGVFLAVFSKYSVTAGTHFDDNGFLHVKDESGTLIDTIDTDALVGEGMTYAAAKRLLGEIHTMARRTAMGAEAAIDSLLKDLAGPEDDIPF
jgi:hypothetical protein